MKQLFSRIIVRHDNQTNWESADPVLLDGEVGIQDSPSYAVKIGNGVNKWSELPNVVDKAVEEYLKIMPIPYIWYDRGPWFDKVYWSGGYEGVANYNYYLHNDNDYAIKVRYSIYNSDDEIDLGPHSTSDRFHYIVSVGHSVNNVMRQL